MIKILCMLSVVFIVPKFDATATVGTTRFAENFGTNCRNNHGIWFAGTPP